ncbi:MAG: ABC transporter ATP-binding protein [Suipraeoptans sp.]
MSILESKSVGYYYQDGDSRRYILKEAEASFEEGKFYTILGQSGSGKTTFLSLLGALDKPQEGEILYKGENINKIGDEKYRRNNVGIVFQNYNLIPYMTAVENILVPMSITENNVPNDEKSVAYNLLDYLGLAKTKADRTVNKLSGGEQQRVAIARALATNVDIIMADEPTGNLDEEMEGEMVDIFKDLAHNHNKCVIVVTHSNEIVQESDVIYYLKKGELSTDE